jgi:hypothetical protein
MLRSDHGMVIAHRTRQQDVDLGAQRGGDQTVEEGVVVAASGRSKNWRWAQRRVTR